jgi:SsrA-binding protein
MKAVATNKTASHDYFLLEKFEAGLALKGAEVKSIRRGKVNLKDSFARVFKNEIYVYNIHISPYEYATQEELDPKRERKLLLKKKEIDYLVGKMTQRGLALVPLRLYFKRGFAKLEIALARGKKLYDKRRQLKEKEAQLEIKRALRKK